MSGKRHTVSLILIGIAFLLALASLAGATQENVAWGYVTAKTDSFTFLGKTYGGTCKSYFQLTQFTTDLSSCLPTSDGKKTIKFDDGEKCAGELEDMCHDCKQSGKSIIALESLALVVMLVAMFLVYKRYTGFDYRISTSLSLIIAFNLIFISVVLWSTMCEKQVEEEYKKIYSAFLSILALEGVTVKLTYTVYAGYALSCSAAVLILIAAIIQIITPTQRAAGYSFLGGR